MQIASSQGFEGELSSELDGKPYACVFSNGSTGSACFGRLFMNKNGEPCPEGIGLPSSQQALGFRRRTAKDGHQLFLRVELGEHRTSRLEIDWFMPVMTDDGISAVWNTFLSKIDAVAVKHLHRPPSDTPSLSQPFDVLEAKLQVTVADQQSVLSVAGLAFNTTQMAYQFGPGARIGGHRPVTLVRGWSESADKCRVIFQDRKIPSVDATFAYL